MLIEQDSEDSLKINFRVQECSKAKVYWNNQFNLQYFRVHDITKWDWETKHATIGKCVGVV